MECSDYTDWMAASNALDIQKEISARHVATYGQQSDKKVHQQRKGELEKMGNELQLMMGFNPFKRDDNLIKRSWERLSKKKAK